MTDVPLQEVANVRHEHAPMTSPGASSATKEDTVAALPKSDVVDEKASGSSRHVLEAVDGEKSSTGATTSKQAATEKSTTMTSSCPSGCALTLRGSAHTGPETSLHDTVQLAEHGDVDISQDSIDGQDQAVVFPARAHDDSGVKLTPSDDKEHGTTGATIEVAHHGQSTPTQQACFSPIIEDLNMDGIASLYNTGYQSPVLVEDGATFLDAYSIVQVRDAVEHLESEPSVYNDTRIQQMHYSSHGTSPSRAGDSVRSYSDDFDYLSSGIGSRASTTQEQRESYRQQFQPSSENFGNAASHGLDEVVANFLRQHKPRQITSDWSNLTHPSSQPLILSGETNDCQSGLKARKSSSPFPETKEVQENDSGDEEYILDDWNDKEEEEEEEDNTIEESESSENIEPSEGENDGLSDVQDNTSIDSGHLNSLQNPAQDSEMDVNPKRGKKRAQDDLDDDCKEQQHRSSLAYNDEGELAIIPPRLPKIGISRSTYPAWLHEGFHVPESVMAPKPSLNLLNLLRRAIEESRPDMVLYKALFANVFGVIWCTGRELQIISSVQAVHRGSRISKARFDHLPEISHTARIVLSTDHFTYNYMSEFSTFSAFRQATALICNSVSAAIGFEFRNRMAAWYGGEATRGMYDYWAAARRRALFEEGDVPLKPEDLSVEDRTDWVSQLSQCDTLSEAHEATEEVFGPLLPVSGFVTPEVDVKKFWSSCECGICKRSRKRVKLTDDKLEKAAREAESQS